MKTADILIAHVVTVRHTAVTVTTDSLLGHSFHICDFKIV